MDPAHAKTQRTKLDPEYAARHRRGWPTLYEYRDVLTGAVLAYGHTYLAEASLSPFLKVVRVWRWDGVPGDPAELLDRESRRGADGPV